MLRLKCPNTDYIICRTNRVSNDIVAELALECEEIAGKKKSGTPSSSSLENFILKN